MPLFDFPKHLCLGHRSVLKYKSITYILLKPKEKVRKLEGLTVFITGATRGIGRAIAIKCASEGANIVIAAKTAAPHPKLPGTVYSVAKEIEAIGGKCLPCVVDIRSQDQIKNAVSAAVQRFGGIDILINNASALKPQSLEQMEIKTFDLLLNINVRGTTMVTKECLPYLKKSKHAHIINLSPPLSMDPRWFADYTPYTITKYGMSMLVLGLSRELMKYGIGVNALWPKTIIYTSAVEVLAGKHFEKHSRTAEIVADAALAILVQNPKQVTGNFFIDEDVLLNAGVKNFDRYACDQKYKDDLMLDFFIADDLPKPKL